MISVLVICKRNHFIQRVQSYLLKQAIEVVAICNNSSIGIERYQKIKVDVVIVDANWPSYRYAISGSELIQQLKTENPDCKIIISTTMKDQDAVDRLRRYNINGYFYRYMDNALNAIVNCIKTVHAGKEYFPS